MTITTHPGVYIEEDASLSLSVRTSATAVPVFAVKDDNSLVSNHSYIRVNSWLEYLTKKKESFNPADKLDISLRAYFINGGGYGYLVRTGKLTEQIPKLDDVTLLVAAGENIKTAVNTLCQSGKGLFAILDGPTSELNSGGTFQDDYDQNSFAAVYYPYLTADWATNDIPPSATIAGVYCSIDRTRGVWKAPANVVLQGGVKPKFKVTDDLQGIYNKGKAINMIREFPNTGVTVWGARTLDDHDNWRYIPVRRLFNSAERDIKNAMSFAVFEPNSQPTWKAVHRAIDNYLYALWQQGGLAGNKAEQAYFVQIGKDITMNDDDIKQGRMIVKVGLAAVRPAEFIILQFTQNVAQS
ncbi:phage tail sheath family protein [Photorhabdus luminescens]|uniref:phage tail sheath family protein n=1 Tax=Photorhabdus luminescens TaxID=29488 RepID=UPI00223F19A3|nr:phage tail sheath C-terminal domain-containing protein [Photorhabdus luminescens]MCW7762584.1 phage tail sheath subtilisin-like domain-containing protein [Photorhabdus luminescens subsp. venezuelensis]